MKSEKISVVVPAHNDEATLLDALRSVERSWEHFQTQDGGGRSCEIVIVDDCSRDATSELAAGYCVGRPDRVLIRRDEPGGPASARNAGVAASSGDVLLFLDADDLFLEPHVSLVLRALDDPTVDVVKTGVALDDPVHPTWRARIVNSLVINLALRRRLHDEIGGFFDVHLFRKRDGRLVHELDVFRSIEDVFYNQALFRLFRCVFLAEETVRYTRRPGNSFDRQYEKFRVAPGLHQEKESDERRLQVALGSVFFRHEMEALKKRMTSNGPDGA
ncbi:glycosyltransferase family 2 protein [Paludisphaera rhizosphaerae]|uniref:glycosyltransferase family 2 protein n=1 Tax=Paludisphaera rhizosphaerae TaxID=2711216 RepID=UPI0013EDFF70|nr:glycosyltransferase family 2 protein [Paludisphaera rhizosphaerae]